MTESYTIEPYKITYNYHFKVGNKTFAFRKGNLFDVTDIPSFKPILENNGSKGWWIDRVWYSFSKVEPLVVKEPLIIDVSNLQWYQQCRLDECFNLELL